MGRVNNLLCALAHTGCTCVLLARSDAGLLHLLRGGIDLLLGLLHGFLALLHLLLLERRSGGGGTGGFNTATGQGGRCG